MGNINSSGCCDCQAGPVGESSPLLGKENRQPTASRGTKGHPNEQQPPPDDPIPMSPKPRTSPANGIPHLSLESSANDTGRPDYAKMAATARRMSEQENAGKKVD